MEDISIKMSGLHIITEHIVNNGNKINIIPAIFFFFVALTMILGVVAVVMLAFECIKEKSKDIDDILMSFCLILMGFLLVIVCIVFARLGFEFFECAFDKTTHIEYTATIDEELNYIEFTEKYEILSEADGVYRIREKEDSEE